MGLKKDLLLVLTIESVVLGVVIGFVIRPFNPRFENASTFLRTLAQVRARDARKIGIVTVIYYMTTTFLSTFTGIILVSSIHPGDPALIHALGQGTLENTALSTLDTFLDQISRCIFSGLIVFCSGFGVILSILGDQARLMINFFIVLDAIIMRWISALMCPLQVLSRCYPIGILSLVCKNIVDIDNLTETAQALAMYVVTVICGLMIHSLLTLPLLYFMVTRKSPFAYMTGMLQALATAFGTASSGATLPVTFRALEENLKIDRRVTRFVLPLGATITMVCSDGTALYEAVAVIFIAQLHNVKLTLLELLTISVTTTVASIGSGSVPAGLDTIVIVLTTVGLPAKDLSLLLTVDWLLDRIRTSVNVLGDGFGAGIIHHLTKDSLVEADTDELIRQIREDIRA
ncbi:transporter, dicarboxylate/amino acid:cation Na+/H+ symporter family protein [Ancylostoma ceylanicum]|uniref:Amino acid transporter n=1 Tax=Ancylostoma ceylanicum TaxID=53326 RepID=A0A0D6M9D7_9BILA|nr:transporter, dicarboxylate/amino acid:cation Na+/H+ symporter family protein [Ancylostoma ceylanicum]